MKLLMYTHTQHKIAVFSRVGGLEECRTVPVMSCRFVLYVNLMCVCVCVCVHYDSIFLRLFVLLLLCVCV